jgi:hypothetical protein
VRTSLSWVVSRSASPALSFPTEHAHHRHLAEVRVDHGLEHARRERAVLAERRHLAALDAQRAMVSTWRTPWFMKSSNRLMPITLVAEVISTGCSALARTAAKNAALTRSVELLVLEVLHHQLVVGLDDGLDQALAVLLRHAATSSGIGPGTGSPSGQV